MKRTVYIQARDIDNNDIDGYYVVTYTTYREGMSLSAFQSLNLEVAYQLQQKLRTLNVYKFTYYVEHKTDFNIKVRMYESNKKEYPDIKLPKPTIIGEFDNLWDFYDHIKYDHKTKKFDGKTLNKVIREGIEAL